uniref:Uncharacterized protein AlNc14C2G280 n=1 Tax=Albugo laibachii Nc14 TaxID=890382 RepID=F0VZE2_9STRA|nr:conserved hypothetical protein [Albugo laibachii Nc14]|eukprot:CCA14172.1 conserved hypothetical protein [Albugo laibachii Nc14]
MLELNGFELIGLSRFYSRKLLWKPEITRSLCWLDCSRHTSLEKAKFSLPSECSTPPYSQKSKVMPTTKRNKKKMDLTDLPVPEGDIRAILIGNDGNLSRDFEAVLTKLFLSYLEKPTDTSITAENLKKFSLDCNEGEAFSDHEIKDIQTYFQCDEKKQLTLKGFKDMYHTQSSAESLETWRDMRNLGYEKELVERYFASLKCHVCKEASSFVCSRCKLARYCSEDCQKKDWKVNHKVSCKVIHA